MEIRRVYDTEFIIWRDKIADMINDSASVNFPNSTVDSQYGNRRCDRIVDYLKDGSAIVFLAFDNDMLVGWLWCHQIERLNRKRLHIAELSVVADYRHIGIGRQLIKTAELYALESGYSEVELFVTDINKNAMSFYERASYNHERSLMVKSVKSENSHE